RADREGRGAVAAARAVGGVVRESAREGARQGRTGSAARRRVVRARLGELEGPEPTLRRQMGPVAEEDGQRAAAAPPGARGPRRGAVEVADAAAPAGGRRRFLARRGGDGLRAGAGGRAAARRRSGRLEQARPRLARQLADRALV